MSDYDPQKTCVYKIEKDGKFVVIPYTMPKQPFPHGKHLVLDLLTCGAWIPFHLVMWVCH